MSQTEYIRHFGMSMTPFARIDYPRWLFLCSQHKEAVLKLRWMVQEHGGIALIRGDVGAGKSFLIEYLMSVWPHQLGWRCAKIQNTGTIVSPRAFLKETCMAFGLPPSHFAKDMVTRLEDWLVTETYKNNATFVLFIDEAQSIHSRAMPVIRDLANLETPQRGLLQIVMAAQKTIDRKLTNYPALQSRIATVVNLESLSEMDTDAMILHRLGRAGCWDPTDRFPADTMQSIYDASKGNPRDVMIITEAAMKEAFIDGSHRVLPRHIELAFKELEVRRRRRRIRIAEAV